MSSSQLDKLKPEIKNRTEVNLNLSSNVISDSNDETNFSFKLLLNGSSANINIWKSQ